MALETATYINQLVTTNPAGSDPLAAADDHLRLIKSTLKNTFANVTGAVTATQAMLNNPFPVGGIIMWSGATGTIPSGWYLCDGTNSTPDLRDKFIVGAGGAYTVGNTGGNSTTTLSAANLPAHTHTVSGTTDAGGSHSHSITDPGHRHFTYASGGSSGPRDQLSHDTYAGNEYAEYTNYVTTGISINAAAAHTHTFSGTTSSIGSGTAFSNLPPYYALAFIMKSAYA